MAALVLENTMISLRGASWVPTDALSTYCQRTARIRLDDGWRNVAKATVCEVLAYCVRFHAYRMKYFVLRNNVSRPCHFIFV